MARILSIDYGKKRTGIAVTDPLQIIAGGLVTVSTSTLFDFLRDYIDKEQVVEVYAKGYKLNDELLRTAKVVVGKPQATPKE